MTASVKTIARVDGLKAIFCEIAAKRDADVIRFRTCCADPRASK